MLQIGYFAEHERDYIISTEPCYKENLLCIKYQNLNKKQKQSTSTRSSIVLLQDQVLE